MDGWMGMGRRAAVVPSEIYWEKASLVATSCFIQGRATTVADLDFRLSVMSIETYVTSVTQLHVYF